MGYVNLRKCLVATGHTIPELANVLNISTTEAYNLTSKFSLTKDLTQQQKSTVMNAFFKDTNVNKDEVFVKTCVL